MAEKNMNDMTLEDAMKRLDEVVERLSAENVSLEESLTLYEEGVALVKECTTRLESAKRKVELLRTNADGEVATQPFDTTVL